MSKICIMTDSASDISYEDEKKYGVEILPFKVSLGGKDYVSRVDFDNAGFYKLMSENDEIPKTSQITPYEFQEIYLAHAQEGYTDIVLVTINSHGSATYGNSVMAKDAFFGEHPEYVGKINIYNIDGYGYNAQYGWPVLQAAKMRDEGKEADEIAKYLTDLMPKREIFFGMYGLSYAAKSGRIPTAAAFFGDKMGLKPIMRIFDNEITTAAKCRGEKKMMDKVIEMTIAEIEPGTPYETIYGDNPDSLEEANALLTKKLGYGPVRSFQIGIAVAANSGPKVIGVAFTKKM